MTITKFVEVGRVVKINYGINAGKLATIVEILNDKRVLIDGPTTGVSRQVIPLRRLLLTKILLKATRGARTGVLKKTIEKNGITQLYESTGAATKVAKKEIRAKLTDFDRFKVMILKKRRSTILAHQVRVLKKASSTQKGQKAAPKAKKQ